MHVNELELMNCSQLYGNALLYSYFALRVASHNCAFRALLLAAGIELSLSEDGDVWLRVESERPVFVLSDYLTHAAALDRDRNANLSGPHRRQQSASGRGSTGDASSSSPEAALAESGPALGPSVRPLQPPAALSPSAFAAALNNGAGPGMGPGPGSLALREHCTSIARQASTPACTDHVHKIYPFSNPIKVCLSSSYQSSRNCLRVRCRSGQVGSGHVLLCYAALCSSCQSTAQTLIVPSQRQRITS